MRLEGADADGLVWEWELFRGCGSEYQVSCDDLRHMTTFQFLTDIWRAEAVVRSYSRAFQNLKLSTELKVK